MTSKRNLQATYKHFAKRVHQRIGGGINPRELWHGLIWAVENRKANLVGFVARISKTGRRVFKFRTPDGRTFFVIYDTEIGCPITILHPDWECKTHPGMNQDPIELEKYV